MRQYATNAYTYDNHGDCVSKTVGAAVTQYTYDEFGNLTGVVLPGGTQIDYVIDALHRRIGKKVNGTLVRRWLWDGPLRIVAELDGDGTLVSRFVYATRLNVPDYVVQGSTTYRLITDNVRSPRLLIDSASGVVAGAMNHDEFGRVLQDTLSGLVPFGFAGGLYDPDTGLVRFGARDYDAETGRWTSKDPIGFRGGQAGLYTYVGNSPLTFVDPTGLDAASGATTAVSNGVGAVGTGISNGAGALGSWLLDAGSGQIGTAASNGIGQAFGGGLGGVPVPDGADDPPRGRSPANDVATCRSISIGSSQPPQPLAHEVTHVQQEQAPTDASVEVVR